MIAVDASVWVSLLLVGDVHRPATRLWFRQREQVAESVVAPVLLLPEVAGVVARRTGRTLLGERAIADILRDPAVTLIAVDGSLAEEAARLAVERRLRGADAVYVALARRLNVPLVTWDREQCERSAGIVDVREPVPLSDDEPT